MIQSFRNLTGSIASLALIAVGSVALTQMTAGASPAVRPDKKAPRGRFVPLHELVKIAGFKIFELPATNYNFMLSEMALLPKGFLGKLKSPQPMVQLSYGLKKGGIVRIYQTKAIAGLDPRAFMQKVADLGVFKDVNRRSDWTFTPKTSRGIFVFTTSTDSKLISDAIASLKL